MTDEAVLKLAREIGFQTWKDRVTEYRKSIGQDTSATWLNYVEREHMRGAYDTEDRVVAAIAAIEADTERAAQMAAVYSSIHVEKRDDALSAKNVQGALTIARQAQTCDELAAALRAHHHLRSQA